MKINNIIFYIIKKIKKLHIHHVSLVLCSTCTLYNFTLHIYICVCVHMCTRYMYLEGTTYMHIFINIYDPGYFLCICTLTCYIHVHTCSYLFRTTCICFLYALHWCCSSSVDVHTCVHMMYTYIYCIKIRCKSQKK